MERRITRTADSFFLSFFFCFFFSFFRFFVFSFSSQVLLAECFLLRLFHSNVLVDGARSISRYGFSKLVNSLQRVRKDRIVRVERTTIAQRKSALLISVGVPRASEAEKKGGWLWRIYVYRRVYVYIYLDTRVVLVRTYIRKRRCGPNSMKTFSSPFFSSPRVRSTGEDYFSSRCDESIYTIFRL